jgi:hypothetical protein
VALAGLFHSVYGTEMLSMRTLNLSRRDEVAALIGEPAETLVYLFCAGRRLSIYANVYHDEPYWIEFVESGDETSISSAQLADLLLLDVANTVEQVLRVGPGHGLRDTRELYEAAAPLIPDIALSEMRTALAHPEETLP